MKVFFTKLFSRLMPTIIKIGQTAGWQKIILVIALITLVLRLVRDKSWKVFTAYFVIILINVILYAILQTPQIKENSEIFFNETNWVKWCVFILSICSYVFANHLVLTAIKKYLLDDFSLKIGKWDFDFALFTSIFITIIYLFYINMLISSNGQRSLFFSIGVSIAALLFINFLHTKTTLFTDTSIWHFFDYFDIKKFRLVKEIPPKIKNNLKFKAFLLAIGTIIYLLLAIADGKQLLIESFSSQSTIFFGFTFFILLYGEFIVIPKVNQLKFFTIALIFSIGFSFFNDPSAPEYLQREKERQNYVTHFSNWVDKKDIPENGTLPLIFIASEGGGIRAMSWTMLMLDFLSKESEIENFNEYLYAISGVSGGAVGATFYVSMLKDQLVGERASSKDSTLLTDIILQDYLTDLVRGNIFRFPLKLFSPLKLPFLDRNKMLENSWSGAYTKLAQKNTLNEPFLNLWSSDSTYDIPSLILNGTFAETGQKTIISNIDFSDSENQFQIKNVVDLYALLNKNKDLPTKTAASLSARFPLVTSGALIEDNNKRKSGHITDGGYHDNTGLETCIQIINLLRPEIARIEKLKNIKIKPYIFFLKNGMNLDDTKTIKPATYAYESRSIWGSFYNSWDRGAEIKNAIYSDLLKDSTNKLTYVLIELKRKEGDFPLGWQLSQKSVAQMKSLINTTYNIQKPANSISNAIKLSTGNKSYPTDTNGIKFYKETMYSIQNVIRSESKGASLN